MKPDYQFASLIFIFSVYLFFISFRGNREYWVAVENEIQLNRKTKKLEELSNTDVLTGIYNRRYFDNLLELEWKRGSREDNILSLIICDIDFFKRVNDSYGHLAGDEYLKKTAAVIAETFKRESDITARYGGEEFVILLPGCNSEDAFELAEKARKRIEKTYVKFGDVEINSTMSFGISSCIPQFSIKSSQLIAEADAALYTAKNDGKNSVKMAVAEEKIICKRC